MTRLDIDRKFIFTITPGHSGTTWLRDLLAINLPDSRVFHEILGYDRFGVDTPDVSHMTLFNSQGNVEHVRAFWRQKAKRIISQPVRWYGETSHLLAKSGLMENIELFASKGQVYILCLDRDLLNLVRSMRRRHDMVNKGNQWLWHLDPDYPRKLVAKEFFMPYGLDGIRLWYGCEMRARAAYYRLLLAEDERVKFVSTSIESLGERAGLAGLFAQLGLPMAPEEIEMPARSNVSGGEHSAGREPIADVIRQMHFDPEKLAGDYLARGYRLGLELATDGLEK